MNIQASQAQARVPVAILTVSGAISSNVELEHAAQQALGGGGQHILVDLAGVPYMATAGLRALNEIFRLLTPADELAAANAGLRAGSYKSPYLKLLKPNALVLEALRAGGYDMFLAIHQERQAAIEAF